jgi:hypothetical protein
VGLCSHCCKCVCVLLRGARLMAALASPQAISCLRKSIMSWNWSPGAKTNCQFAI